MTVQKLRRVMWRLRQAHPNQDKILNAELHRAIMHEMGTDIRTYKANRKALMTLKWIKAYKNKHIILTNDDLTS